MIIMINVFSGLLYLNTSTEIWVSLVEFENTENTSIFLQQKFYDKSNPDGHVLKLFRGKFVYKDTDGYRYYPLDITRQFYMEGKEVEQVFKQDNDGYIVTYDRENSIFSKYNPDNTTILIQMTDKNRNVLELFDATEQVKKLIKRDT